MSASVELNEATLFILQLSPNEIHASNAYRRNSYQFFFVIDACLLTATDSATRTWYSVPFGFDVLPQAVIQKPPSSLHFELLILAFPNASGALALF